MDVEHLPVPRPPCSRGERAAAEMARRRLADLGLSVATGPLRATTSPVWGPLIAAIARLATAVLIILGPGGAAVVAAGAAAVLTFAPGGVERVARYLPLLGGTSTNTFARIAAASPAATDEDGDHPPLIVSAHLDAHPSGGAPLVAAHRGVVGGVCIALLATALLAWLSRQGLASALALVWATEPFATLAWLARRELGTTDVDDNASGVAGLLRSAELLTESPPVREVWLVATGCGMTGGHGMRAFLRAHPGVRRVAWALELDALGAAEIVIAPTRRGPRGTSTAPAVVRAVAGAALEGGDPLHVRRVRRRHGDAPAALRMGVPALALTGGVRPPEEQPSLDLANVERAARIVDQLARTPL